MSTKGNSYSFRCRTIGRAASPPTWACYEQIPYDDEYSDDSESESCSEDDEDYSGGYRREEPSSDDSEKKETGVKPSRTPDDLDMDMEDEDDGDASKAYQANKDIKGKQRAMEEEEEPEKSPKQRKKRSPVYTLRPILTIQRSQGFVWNQDLFVPPYIKDRYIASTSPPNSKGFISSSVSSTNSALTDYEVEVVEIRVKEGDLDYIIP